VEEWLKKREGNLFILGKGKPENHRKFLMVIRTSAREGIPGGIETKDYD